LIECEIQNDGTIYENSQITFSGESGISDSDQTKLDMLVEDIKFCLANDIDYIIHSVYQGK
jgi:pyruvate kinase